MGFSSKFAKLTSFILFVVGAVLLAVGCSVRWVVFPEVLDDQVAENLKLEPGTDTYDAFITPPIPIYMNFVFFNVTNPEEVKAGNAAPILKEVGPYVYSETRHKEKVTDGGADSLYYNERRAYYFDQEESERSGCTGCQKNDKVMILSPVWALVNYAWPLIPRDLNIPLPKPYNVYGNITYNLISNLLAMFNSPEDGVFLNASVDDVLYEGVPTGLTDAAWQILQGVAPDLIPKINDAVPQFANGKFGIFKGKNDTVKDMFYRVNNGDGGLSEFMQILEFNGKASLNEFWWPDVARKPSTTKMGGKGVCHDIKGTDGTLFAPGLDTDKSLWVFVPELCRSIWLDYDTDVTVMDIPAKRFRPGPKVFDMHEPDNFCYCPKFLECATKNTTDDTYDPTPCEADEFACVDGLIHVGKCLIGNVNPVIPPLPPPFDIINTSSIDVALPISMSSPHFFRADPKLLSMFEGLSPDPAIHDVTLDLDPITGLAVSAHKRIQINMPLTKIDDFIPFKNLNQTFPAFPIMWVDERATIDKPNADKWDSQVGKAFRLVNGLSFSLGLALGGLAIVISWILVIFCVG